MKNKSFGKVIAVIVLLVALVGIGGFTVAKHDENVKKAAQNTTQNAGQNSSTKSESDEQVFSNNDFSFAYPKTWVKATGEAGETVFQSSDYTLEEVPGNYEGNQKVYRISKGYKLTVKMLDANVPNKTIAELTQHIVEEEQTLGGGNHKALDIDGNPTLLVNSKQTDQSLYAIIFHEHAGLRAHVQLDCPDDSSAETTAVFDKILSSLTVN